MAAKWALGVDTSNYATSLAVVDAAEKKVLCAQKRFLPVKQGELGLRQSDAVFHHTVALPEMIEAVGKQVGLDEITAVGVSSRPRPVEGSYMPCFLAGVSFAAAFAAARACPLLYTSHQEGHLAAALFGAGRLGQPEGVYLFLHVSGGTTEWWLARGTEPEQRLGGSLDLHAGQVLDRLGVRLGFGFPAGAEVSRLAASCADAVKPKASMRGLDCSLSGLQNQYETLLNAGAAPEYAAKFCLVSLAEVFVQVIRTVRKSRPDIPVLCAGGVMSSAVIAEYVMQQVGRVTFVPAELSSDNAVGVAFLAGEKLNG